MKLLTPWEHRRQIRYACQIGTMPSNREITRAYFRYVARSVRQAWAS